MPKKDPSDSEWLKSPEFFSTPQAKLLYEVIVQAIDDSSVEIKDPPKMPKYPPKRPPEPAKDADMLVYWAAKRAFDKRAKTVSGKIRAIRERKQNQDHARRWLMSDYYIYDGEPVISSFPRIAALLGIDADIIRDAITKQFDWAKAKRWQNTLLK